MEGFGVHTFRCVNTEGETSLVKFYWKPVLGVHSLVWEEAQLLSGLDPDFHRRDLYDAIESGAHPSWELGLQVFPDVPEQMFEGIDLLDPTKLVPEEIARPDAHADTLVHDMMSGVRYYRANASHRRGRPRERRTTVPVLQLVMTHDSAVRPACLLESERWTQRLERVELPQGHWAALTHPDDVAQETVRFIDSVS